MSSKIDWNKYKTEEKTSENQIDWNKYKTQKSSSPYDVIRHGTRTASRIYEMGAGILGDFFSNALEPISQIKEELPKSTKKIIETPGKILKEIRNLPFQAIEKLTGKKSKAFEAIKDLGIFPTSEELKKTTEKLSEGYLEPKNEYEKIGDEVTQDLVGLMIPGGGLSFLRKLGMVAAGNIAKQGVKLLGGEEISQQATKIGTMLITGLTNRSNAVRYYQNLYTRMRQSIPQNASTNAVQLQTGLINILRDLQSGGVQTETNRPVMRSIRQILGRIQNNQMSVQELVDARRNINELMGDPELLRRGRNAFPRVINAIDNSLNDYGRTNQPFLENLRTANEAYAGVQQSRRASNFIRRHFRAPQQIGAGTLLLLESMTLSPKAALGTAAGLIGARTGIAAMEFTHRVINNPTLRRYYLNVMEQAVREDAVALNKAIKDLDNAIKKEKIEVPQERPQPTKAKITPTKK